MDPNDREFIELLEPSIKRKMHIMVNELEFQLKMSKEASKEWDKVGEEAEKEIQEHFGKCLVALAERKAALMKEVAQKVSYQSML
jgi:hypothetical protein